MDYEKEIEKKRKEIKELEDQQQAEIKNSFPNIIGKNYRPSTSTLYKVKEVTHILGETHCIASVISVQLRGSGHAEIFTAFMAEIDIDDIDEVSDERFLEHLNKAISAIIKHS